MKKSYLAALAALTLSTSTLASVSLSGNASVTFQNSTEVFTGSANLIITGEFKGSTLSSNLNLVTGEVSETQLTTSIGPVELWAEFGGRTEISLTTKITDSITMRLANHGDSRLEFDVSDNLKLSLGEYGVFVYTSFAGFDINASDNGNWDIRTTINGVDLQFDDTRGFYASTTIGQTQVSYTLDGDSVIELSRDLDSGANLTVAYSIETYELLLTTSVEF